MFRMIPKINKYGFKYFDELPADTRLATIDDFHLNGRLKVGMSFIIHQLSDGKYGLYCVKESLKGEKIKPFIDDGRAFVFNPEKYNQDYR